MGRFARLTIIGLLGSLTPALAAAQSAITVNDYQENQRLFNLLLSFPVPVAQLVPRMITSAAVLAPGSLAPGNDQSRHFVAAAGANPALAGLNRTLALLVGGFPIGPTGTTVLFGGDSSTDGKMQFASGYTDGAATLGRGRRSLAVSYQDTTYDSLDGLDLRGSSINLFVRSACCSSTESDRDLLQETLSLRVHRRATAFALGYGVTDRLDIGVVVPFVQVVADARVETAILRTATPLDPGIHEFNPIGFGDQAIPGGGINPDGQRTVPGLAGTGTSAAKGVGDIVLRSKLRLLRSGNQAMAVGVDLQLPTGNADELIGLGATRVTPAVMWSMASRRAGARAKIDYTRSFGSLSSLLASPGVDLKVPNELGYEIGFDLAVAPRTTFVADLVGRRIPGVAAFSTTNTVFSSSGPGPLPSNFVGENNLQETQLRTLNTILVSTGARVYLGGPIFADLRVLFPTGSSGLRPRPTGVFSLDYAF